MTRTTGSRDDRLPRAFAVTVAARRRRGPSVIGAGLPVEVAIAAVTLQLRREAFPLLADRLASVQRAGGSALEFNGCVRPRAKVQTPGGILLARRPVKPQLAGS